MKVGIIGRTQILYETALRLLENNHQIGCIITAKAAIEYTRDENDFEHLAEKLGVPFLLTNTLNHPEVEDMCSGLDVGVSVNWISVIREKHLKLFRLGILNSHNGDLPHYRGNACSNWAILNNEKKITNTVHFMEDNNLDCGRIIHQEHFELGENSTITEVYRWTEKSVPQAFVSALDKLEKDNGFTLKYADPEAVDSFRCYPRLPEDGFIEWNQSALKIHNLIRAVTRPFAGAYTYCWDKQQVRKLIILKSRLVEHETKDLAVPGHILKNDKHSGESFVSCGCGTIALLKCHFEDESEDFLPGQRWKSIRMRLGIRAEDWLWTLTKNNNDFQI